MNPVKIAGVQMDVKIGEVAYNLSRIEQAMRETTGAGALLTVFPECALAGYCFGSLEEAREFAEPVSGPSVGRLIELCQQTESFAVVGMLELDGASVFNSSVLLGRRGVVGVYRKTHLPFLGVDRFATAGPAPPQIWQAGPMRIGMNICYDGSFPECSRLMALAGADLIVLPTNWPGAAENFARYVINTRAMENHVYYLAVNRIGEERGFRFIGLSRACSPHGDTLAEADHAEDAILYAEIDPAESRRKRLVRIAGQHEIDRFKDRRPDLYGELVRHGN